MVYYSDSQKLTSQFSPHGNRQATRSRSPADFAAVPGATASKMWTQQRDSTDVLHNILHYVETRQAIACCPAGTSKFCSLVILAGLVWHTSEIH